MCLCDNINHAVGLLAGLHEFPSVADVNSEDSESPSSLRRLGERTVRELVVDSIMPKKNKDDRLCLSNITSGGDVLHVFSHIRKTYRIQWILLEGGEERPTLKLDHVQTLPAADGKTRKPGKGKVESQPKHSNLRWVPLEDIPKAK